MIAFCAPMYVILNICKKESVTTNRGGIDSLVEYVIDFGSDYAVLFENELLQLVPYAKSA